MQKWSANVQPLLTLEFLKRRIEEDSASYNVSFRTSSSLVKLRTFCLRIDRTFNCAKLNDFEKVSGMLLRFSACFGILFRRRILIFDFSVKEVEYLRILRFEFHSTRNLCTEDCRLSFE